MFNDHACITVPFKTCRIKTSSGQTQVRSDTDTPTLKTVFGGYINLIYQHRISVHIARQLLHYRPFVCNSLSLSAQGDGMCSWQGCLQCLLCVWCLFIVWKPLTSPSSLLGSVNRSNVTKYVKNLSMIHVLMQTSMFNMLSSYIHYFIAGCLGKLSTGLHCPV